ncbi:DUF1671-domain-containing protein [Xylariaceae sp. FL0594]|nr:DUF1671-domain-containing protein [Xylariaceae sp. FL0594]
MEEAHPEEGQPSTNLSTAAREVSGSHSRDTSLPGSSSEEDGYFVQCPVDGCLELISSAELQDHLDLHAIEGGNSDDDDDMRSSSHTSASPDSAVAAATDVAGIHNVVGGDTSAYEDARVYQSPYSTHRGDAAQLNEKDDRGRSRPGKRHESAIEAWKKLFHSKKPMAPGKRKTGSGTPPARKRLGKAELGKYAYESQMPRDLVKLLEEGKYVNAEGIIYGLAAVLQQCSTTRHAYLCHPAVQHVSKLRKEGGFCGYRNIQMLASYIVGAEEVMGAETFQGQIPTIFQIQDYIESAWDMGINKSGRDETGGIKGTRKFIGTPEAQALFKFLNIPCQAEGFRSAKAGVAEGELVAAVEKYFADAPHHAAWGGSNNNNDKIRRTRLPPIYFQHRGHSMTIVGFERRATGEAELLVFDPMFRSPPGMAELARQSSILADHTGDDNSKERRAAFRAAEAGLKMYRRGNGYLKKYTEFEILKLVVPGAG